MSLSFLMPLIGLFTLETTLLFFLSFFLDILKDWSRGTLLFFFKTPSTVLSILSNYDNVLSNLFMWWFIMNCEKLRGNDCKIKSTFNSWSMKKTNWPNQYSQSFSTEQFLRGLIPFSPIGLIKQLFKMHNHSMSINILTLSL